MAVSDSTNEVTVRRLYSVITGLWSKITTGFGNKADKVSNATNGHFAGLDANGNLTDSGSKASDFKTKQTAVGDPTASGSGIQFIASYTQDANGVSTVTKKSVRTGSTSQTGVVQLADTIGATETDNTKAATPKAVRDAINGAVSHAYHAAGSKTVADLTSTLLVAANEGCVYNITDSGTTTSDFIEGAGKPIHAGDNVVVCAVVSGGTTVYKFDLLSGIVDLSNYIAKSSTAGLVRNDGSIETNSYLTTTGNASNTTSTFTKATGDTSAMTSGSKLSVILTAISSFFASFKALAFKDKVSDSDIKDTISDSHIASASTWNSKASGTHTHSVTVNGVSKTIPAPGAQAVELMDEMTTTEVQDILDACT